MLGRLKIFSLVVLAIIFCLGATAQAEELDPIAAQHLYTTKDSIIIPIEKLRPSEEVTQKGIAQAMRHIKLRMADSNYPKRAPLDVIERGDGNYTIINGDKTFAALKELGAKNFPAIIHLNPYQENVKNIKDLYALNEAAEDEFHTLMKNLQAELGGELIERPTIKSKERVREKVKLELNGDYSAVADLWAASLVYSNEEELLAAFDKLKNRYDVIYINDRWNNPLPQGYRDIQMNLMLSNGAICELQLHHEAILQVNYNIDHYLYEFRRSHYGNPAMAEYSQRVMNIQKNIYDAVWDGTFANVSEHDKEMLSKTAKKLPKQKAPNKIEFLLNRLESILKFALGEDKIAA